MTKQSENIGKTEQMISNWVINHFDDKHFITFNMINTNKCSMVFIELILINIQW